MVWSEITVYACVGASDTPATTRLMASTQSKQEHVLIRREKANVNTGGVRATSSVLSIARL